MLKVKIGDRDLRVRFGHVPPHFTYCQIYPIGWQRWEAKKDWLDGYAWCHPQDQFCKKTGRKIALARALRDLPRWARKRIWEEYFKVQGGY
jgi:hypothetical protein